MGAINREPIGAVLATLLCLAILAAGGAATTAAAASDAPRCKGQSKQAVKPKDFQRASGALLCLVNIQRAAGGVRPLAWEPTLAAAAREHSQDMVANNLTGHEGSDGSDPTARAKRHGYRAGSTQVNEIVWSLPLAQGVSPIDFFDGFVTSGANYDVMLSEAYSVTGIGFAVGTPTSGVPGTTLTQTFGMVHTRATYTGLDMLVPPECPPARKALEAAKQKLAAAKDAGTGVKKAQRVVDKRRKAAARACTPTHF